MDYTKSEAKAWGRANITGQWTTMVTPFTEDDRIDEEGLRRNVEHVLKLGTKGMGFSWNMGEFWSLTDGERHRLLELAPELVKSRAKLAFQITDTSLQGVLAKGSKAEEQGYDFVILAPPYIMVRSEEQVISFVSAVAEKLNIGIAFYNSPQFGITMSAKGLSRIADIKGVIAIKEASGNIQLGIDTHLSAGGKAVVSVPDEEIFFYAEHYGFHQQAMFANTSDWRFDTASSHDYVGYINLATSGRLAEAKELYKKVRPVKMVSRKWWSRLVARTGGALPVQMAKAWGELMGMSGGHVRPPLQPMTAGELAEMRSDIASLGLIQKE